MSDYEQVAGLGLTIESLELQRRELALDAFTRVTTTVRLGGAGESGEGEDVTYQANEHDGFPEPDLTGDWTLDELSQRLESLELPDYRRWAFESAALDLALRQAGRSLGDAVGRPYRPVRFVVSTRSDIRRFLAEQPDLEFKVDPDERLVAHGDGGARSDRADPRRRPGRATTATRRSTSLPTRASIATSSRSSRTR